MSKGKYEGLDFNKPIVAIDEYTGDIAYLLVPSLVKPGSYKVKGYNWLRFKDGIHNSCTTWETKEEALDSYDDSYNFENIEWIEVEDTNLWARIGNDVQVIYLPKQVEDLKIELENEKRNNFNLAKERDHEKEISYNEGLKKGQERVSKILRDFCTLYFGPLFSGYVPIPGDKFTCSVNRACGDRSYSHDIWECVSNNGVSLQMKGEGRGWWAKQTQIITISEYYFAPAEHFVND